MPRNCTPSLIKKKRKHVSVFRAIFKKGTDNGFYTAVSHDGSTSLWWIEANQLGSTSCYPCFMVQNGEEHAFVSSRADKAKASNKALMEKWRAAVTPENIDELYTVTEMNHEDFFREFTPAEERQMKKLFYPKKSAEAVAAGENASGAEQNEEIPVEKDEADEAR